MCKKCSFKKKFFVILSIFSFIGILTYISNKGLRVYRVIKELDRTEVMKSENLDYNILKLLNDMKSYNLEFVIPKNIKNEKSIGLVEMYDGEDNYINAFRLYQLDNKYIMMINGLYATINIK